MSLPQARVRPTSAASSSTSVSRPTRKATTITTAVGTFARTNSRRDSTRSSGAGSSPYAGATPTASKVRRVMKVSTTSPLRPTTGTGRAGGSTILPPHPSLREANEAAKLSTVPRGSTPVVQPRHRYVVGIMSHCGSIYEELTRQLVATGRWSSVSVKQRASPKALFVGEMHQDISDVNIHLLLGDKPSSEQVIASRRALHAHIHHGSAKSNTRPKTGPRVPMGNGDDGEPRLVDFVENTRCITLKSMMLATLTRHHRHNWSTLGEYLPMTFKIFPGKPFDDERRSLLEVSRRFMPSTTPLWIAKSSSGCHGDDIQIFSGDKAGLRELLVYVDSRTRVQPWVAQQYIDRPLLYHKRKFDIRCMVLYIRETSEIFVHEDLVMRLSSVTYDRESATGASREAKLAHITNHCIQETGNMYSTFEEGNELWKEHLDGLIRYKADRLPAARRRELLKAFTSQNPIPHQGLNGSGLNTSRSTNPGQSPYPTDLGVSDGVPSTISANHSGAKGSASGITLRNVIMPQINNIVVDTVLAAQPFLPVEPKPLPTHCFQLLGYDFLIDESLKVWLLEINGAPGGPTRLVPKIMADTIELAITPFFPCSLDTKPKADNGYTKVYPV